MTAAQIIEAARNNLNAVSDNLWSDTELLTTLYGVELQLSRATRCIEAVSSSTTSVSGTSEYSKPTYAIDVLRVTYDGVKLQRITYDEYDVLHPSGTTTSGDPSYYVFFNDTLILDPVPSTTGDTIKIWSYNQPVTLAASDTPSTPGRYHDALVNGLTYAMCPKDLGHPLVVFWKDKWFTSIAEVEKHVKLRRRADGFATVQREEDALTTNFGII